MKKQKKKNNKKRQTSNKKKINKKKNKVNKLFKDKIMNINNKFKRIIIKLKDYIQKKKIKENIKLDYNSITLEQLEKEVDRNKYRGKYYSLLRSTIYSLLIIVSIALIISTFIMPVLEISTNAMEPKFKSKDLVLAVKTSNIKNGDIIAFYHGNKILIKRVIATSGQWVVVNEDKTVFVDGVKLKEPYISGEQLDDCTTKFPYQVPNESYFVLSDNRTNMIDSRNSEIDSIKKENIIGKIIFKIWDANK